MSPLSGTAGWVFLLFRFAILAVSIVPLGTYMARLYRNQATFLTPILGWVEGSLYKAAGIDPRLEMSWRTYALAALSFSTLGFVILYLVLVSQAVLPGNSSHFPGLAPEQAFTLAAGFVSDTTVVTGENTPPLSLFSRLAGLTVQDFLSAAVGISVFVAISRGLSGNSHGVLGNFWVDLTRTILYVLLPISLAYAALLATAGVNEVLDAYSPGTHQAFPAAGAEALRLIATRSGSVVNANAAHIAAVATPATAMVGFLSGLLIPASLCYAFGLMVGDLRQGLMILILASLGLAARTWGQGDPGLGNLGGGSAAILSDLIALVILGAALFKWLRGQAPSYLGRTLRPFDIAMAAAAVLAPSAILIAAGGGAAALYSVFGLAVLAGRFWVLIPTLAIAGSLSVSRNGDAPLITNG